VDTGAVGRGLRRPRRRAGGERARGAAAGAGEVVVRAAGVHALDTAALQILIALRRALAAQGRTLRVDGAPAALVAQWQRAGLAAELGAG